MGTIKRKYGCQPWGSRKRTQQGSVSVDIPSRQTYRIECPWVLEVFFPFSSLLSWVSSSSHFSRDHSTWHCFDDNISYFKKSKINSPKENNQMLLLFSPSSIWIKFTFLVFIIIYIIFFITSLPPWSIHFLLYIFPYHSFH